MPRSRSGARHVRAATGLVRVWRFHRKKTRGPHLRVLYNKDYSRYVRRGGETAVRAMVVANHLSSSRSFHGDSLPPSLCLFCSPLPVSMSSPAPGSTMTSKTRLCRPCVIPATSCWKHTASLLSRRTHTVLTFSLSLSLLSHTRRGRIEAPPADDPSTLRRRSVAWVWKVSALVTCV